MNPTAAPKVSILVPIYNVEHYLRKCINSLVSQTLKDIEILLLDDGSTDDSAQICDAYAMRDSRIRVIHKNNSGYGATLNQGIEQSQGEYIGILEGDDWAENTMYQTLYAIAKENDVQVVKAEFYEYTDEQGNKAAELFSPRDAGRIIDAKTNSDIFLAQPSIWSAIYKRHFLIKQGIRFLETPGASYQDISFNFKVLFAAERLWLEKKCLVHYRKDNALASVRSSGKVFCVRDEWEEIERYMKAYPEARQSSERLRTHARFANYMWNVNRLSGGAKIEFQRYFWCQYREAMRKKKTDGLHDSLFDQVRYISKISPKPFIWKILIIFLRIARLVIKKQRKQNTWKILSCFVVRCRDQHDNKPIFWEKTI